ncbi:DNA polymerase/3'-5' exonuclease PolX [Ramlibacter ginsenosidimutans]|uniref:DNA polymerase beta n=1 Tax=Ramlibacter ginsenosidimutans TaxID=502333 RepID=A0A934WJC7_9BURK|nr:DNA polymerase/3'-5' exonuclease PolX [Ramlibacter ginsenosidimutans]MBK6004519.1 DNA polymerase/3'-5' exonuclease PolX [Ramlibacter ginsenosidimutans]
MAYSNAAAAAVFDEIADLLEVQGGNAFRVRAYRNAARTLAGLGRSAKEMIAAGEDLDDLPGIGKDLAGKIAEIVATGSCVQLDALRKELPEGITELLRLPGIGPRRVQALRGALGVQCLADLQAAAEQGRIRGVRGFSRDAERRILDAIIALLKTQRRVPLATAAPMAAALLAELQTVAGVQQAAVAGSLRRRRDTVGDIDLLVSAGRGSPVMERFAGGNGVQRVLAKGSTRASIVLQGGVQVDLRVVPQASFGAALLYFTGSKPHNIALRRLAQEAGLKLNEYGLFQGAHRVAGDTEESVYRALGLPWIDPELREDSGELDAARADRLPHLVRLQELRGDLHVHTSDSDGRDSLRVMAEAAAARGLSYIAVTDHSRRLAIAHGLDAGRLARQIDLIDAMNEQLSGITLLKGVEVDILKDGKLDLPGAILQRLDLVVGAVHERFDLPADQQTARLLRAMDHPYFSILAHPAARLLGEREPCAFDLERVLRHARERGCFMELNGQPTRLDLDDHACRMARDIGVLVSIASDAHGLLEFGHLDWGVGQARRGWLEARHVLNTRPLEEVRRLLDATMGRSEAAVTS